jgi:6-pyruvoyltetrahydropterin/6-carboxytetrahydropterin synthase
MEEQMFEIGVVAHFEAAHRLVGDFGPATRLHGHTYRVEVGVRGPRLRPNDSLGDLGRLQQAVQTAVSDLHYQDLNALPGFQGRNPTAEGVTRYLFERIAPLVREPGLDVLAVRVWESPNAWAAYEDQLG